MDPWDTARISWASITDTGNLAYCGDKLIYDNRKTAFACQRHLEILGCRRERITSCGNHWHLVRVVDDHLTVQEMRSRQLLLILHDIQRGMVKRDALLDAVDWGDVSNSMRRSYLNRRLAVLDRYDLIARDAHYVYIENPAAIAELVETFSSGTTDA